MMGWFELDGLRGLLQLFYDSIAYPALKQAYLHPPLLRHSSP